MGKQLVELIGNKDIHHFLDEAKLNLATPVQEKGIPLFLKGGSLKVLAQTGTGKTLAYALPLIQKIKFLESSGNMPAKGSPRAIILSPTRELGQQIYTVLKSVSHHAKLRIRFLTSGKSGSKNSNLKEQGIDIVVGSPKRIQTSLERGELSAECLKYLILDESDQLLDNTFKNELEKIVSKLELEYVNVALYSATEMPYNGKICDDIFKNVEFSNLNLSDVHQVKSTLETFNIYLGQKEKEKMLKLFIKDQGTKGIVFVNKKEEVQKLIDLLDENDFGKKFFYIHGDMKKTERADSLKLFRSSKKSVLICTDIMARGLDIDKLDWVLNYDLPFEAVFYLHRSGRVGRSGNRGVVYNFVTGKDENLIARINEAIKNQSAIRISPIKNQKAQAKASKKSSAKSKPDKKKFKKTPRYKRK